MTVARPMTAGELAGRLGHSRDWLYRPGRLDRLYGEGMPRPLSGVGQRRWDRATIEAWLARYHPLHPKRPANDVGASPEPIDDAGWTQRLAAAYRQPEPADSA